MRPFAIMFHHFHDDVRHLRGQGSVAVDNLHAILDTYEDLILDAREWHDRLLAGDLSKGQACLTFDDGLRCQYDIALPALRERGLRAFWFPYSAPQTGSPDQLEIYRHFRTAQFPDVNAFYAAFDAYWQNGPFEEKIKKSLEDFHADQYLSEYTFYSEEDRRFRFIRDRALDRTEFADTIESMLDAFGYDRQGAAKELWMKPEHFIELHEEGHIIGLHSHTHPTRIVDLDRESQAREFDRNATWLREVVGIATDSVAYPCGSYDQGMIRLLEERGIKIGFQSRMGPATSRMEIPRLDNALALTGDSAPVTAQ